MINGTACSHQASWDSVEYLVLVRKYICHFLVGDNGIKTKKAINLLFKRIVDNWQNYWDYMSMKIEDYNHRIFFKKNLKII